MASGAVVSSCVVIVRQLEGSLSYPGVIAGVFAIGVGRYWLSERLANSLPTPPVACKDRGLESNQRNGAYETPRVANNFLGVAWLDCLLCEFG